MRLITLWFKKKNSNKQTNRKEKANEKRYLDAAETSVYLHCVLWDFAVALTTRNSNGAQ